ncbi:MAG: hypothetical protein WC389_17075 [Lutibacter sp.]|jgi:hypothetical protein
MNIIRINGSVYKPPIIKHFANSNRLLFIITHYYNTSKEPLELECIKWFKTKYKLNKDLLKLNQPITVSGKFFTYLKSIPVTGNPNLTISISCIAVKRIKLTNARTKRNPKTNS